MIGKENSTLGIMDTQWTTSTVCSLSIEHFHAAKKMLDLILNDNTGVSVIGLHATLPKPTNHGAK